MFISCLACCFEYMNLQTRLQQKPVIGSSHSELHFQVKQLIKFGLAEGRLSWWLLPASLVLISTDITLTSVALLGRPGTLIRLWHSKMSLLTSGFMWLLRFVHKPRSWDQVHLSLRHKAWLHIFRKVIKKVVVKQYVWDAEVSCPS